MLDIEIIQTSNASTMGEAKQFHNVLGHVN